MADDVRNIRRLLGETLKYVDGKIDVANPSGGGDLPPGGSTGQVLAKQSGADGDADWEDPSGGSALPDGGTVGQVLTKFSNTDGAASWQTPDSGLPPGGTTGQALIKVSGTDGDADWDDVSGVPVGGSTGQVLTKDSGTDGDVSWQTPVGGTQVRSFAGFQSFSQTVAGGGVKLSFDQVEMNVGACWNGPNQAFVAPVDGVYVVTGFVSATAPATFYPYIHLIEGSGGGYNYAYISPWAGSTWGSSGGTKHVRMLAGWSVSLYVSGTAFITDVAVGLGGGAFGERRTYFEVVGPIAPLVL